MINFLKTYSLQNFKKKFILIYILNILDAIFTVTLYSTGLFEEANILLSNVVNNPLLTLSIKIVIPGLLLYFLNHRIQSATTNQLRISNYFLSFIICAYSLIVLSQVFYTVILTFLKI